MLKKLLVAFSIAAFSIASAETYKIRLYQPSFVGENELKPGEYKLEVNEGKAVFTRGKQSVEAEVEVQTADSKFASTSVKYDNGGGKFRVQEIRIGGTSTLLVLN